MFNKKTANCRKKFRNWKKKNNKLIKVYHNQKQKKNQFKIKN